MARKPRRLIPPGPLPDPEVLAHRLSALVDQRAELAGQLGFSMSVHRTVILLLAYERSIHAGDVSAAVRSLAGSPHHEVIGRMRHRKVAYEIMLTLAKRGGLKHRRKGWGPAWFWLPRSVRDILAEQLAEVSSEPRRPAAGKPVSSDKRRKQARPSTRKPSAMRTRKRRAVR